ncbi:TatD family hydrolase, partial [bacterium]|nr:TatD family hydrolase [bacterium]
PWLAPQGFRGKDNEPAYVTIVAKTIAECLGVSEKLVLETTCTTGTKLFF